MMKRTLYYIAGAVLTAGALASCADENNLVTGEGRVFLSASVNSDVQVRSRASLDEIRQSCMLWISDSKGLVRRYNNLSEIPSDGIKLVANHYVAEAWAGDSVPASFDARYFKGREEFDVKAGSTTSVSVNCTVANSVVNVFYEDNVDAVLKDYTITVGHSQGELEFVGRDERDGYFMMNSRDHDLTWTLRGTLPDGSEFTRSQSIKDCKPATRYTLTVSCPAQSDDISGAFLKVQVDAQELVVNNVIQIAVAPTIEGYDFDITKPFRGEPGKLGRNSLYITASAALKSLVLDCDFFGPILGIGGNDFDLLSLKNEYLEQIEAKGLNYTTEYDAEKDMSWLKLNFEDAFSVQVPEGEHFMTVTATDANNKSTTVTVHIIVSSAPVATSPLSESQLAGVWTSKARIYGEIVTEGVMPSLKYREAGATDWIDAPLTETKATWAVGDVFSADLTGLRPGTTYEYKAATSEYADAEVQQFTTESALQFPDADFENWGTHSDKSAIVGDGSFWDSGNHGSQKMNKNVTYADNTVKHGGQYSAKLASQFVGVGIFGRLAAGNIFIGQYLKTDNLDGVLGWGKPFASRPAKLHGWVKYSPVAVTDKGNGGDLNKGDMDNGILYVALLDNSYHDDEFKDFPVVVRTKGSKLFDKNASNVIAYGEIVWREATAGDGMVEFEVPLTYRRTDVKPTYILCTASASIGGDYFTGGNGSTMWLDDLELIYE